MSEITIRKATDEDDEMLLSIYNSIYWDRPPIGVAEYRSMRSRQPARAVGERYVAELDGQVAGSLEFWEVSMFRAAGAVGVFLEVAEPLRHRGIGERLFRLMEERIPIVGWMRVYTSVREDLRESVAFGERRGFRQTGQVECSSRLDVNRARVGQFAAIEERLGEGGIRIVTLRELGTGDEVLHTVHQLENEVTRDMPSAEKRTDRPYEEWKAAVLESPGRSPDTIWLALDGTRPVGIARLARRGERAALHGITGVAREYRGRGIARALKRRTILWSQQNAIDYLYTDNDMENRPMIAINDELGYEILPAEIELMKEYVP